MYDFSFFKKACSAALHRYSLVPNSLADDMFEVQIRFVSRDDRVRNVITPNLPPSSPG